MKATDKKQPVDRPPSSNKDGIFRKSSFSGENGCVEVARFSDGRIQVRSTKDADKKTVEFTWLEWTAILKGVKNREFEV
jgi:hypothetical protein